MKYASFQKYIWSKSKTEVWDDKIKNVSNFQVVPDHNYQSPQIVILYSSLLVYINKNNYFYVNISIVKFT